MQWKWRLRALCLGLAMHLAGVAAADDETYLAEDRARFLEARKALLAGDAARFERLATALHDYPLQPYLAYWALERRLGSAADTEVEAALTAFDGMPLESRLRGLWLDRLGREGRWNAYLAAYRPGLGTTATCRHLDALRRLGRDDEAWAGVPKLWLVGRSQPDACDPLFDAWRAAGRLTPKLAWTRIELALRRGNVKLATYLGRYVSAEERHLLETWIAVRRDPRSGLGDARLASDGPLQRKIVVYGVKRLAGYDAPGAAALWDGGLRARYAFSDEQRWDVERRIALEYAFDGAPEALGRLGAMPPQWQDATVRAWAARVALRLGRWPDVLGWIERMPAEERSEPRWRYWRARALQAGGQADEARALLVDLGRGRGYFEFLAADRLGEPYRINHVPVPSLTPADTRLEQAPAVLRARELYHAGLLSDALREWRAEFADAPRDQLLAAARLAYHWGWYDRAIFALGAASYYDDMEIRFPFAFREELTAQARAQRLDPAWVMAMARQESAFNAGVRSSAGALGLMQIMPATGRRIASDLSTRLRSSSDLLDPALNARFGTHYLRSLLDELGLPILAIAAYNAGPHRVRRWLPADGDLEADVWIENVPFYETRGYLERVLAYTAIYQDRLGRPVEPLTQRMGKVAAEEG